jgi:peptidoglycan/xylan/chitin deacetylase (PgdA/CDA1 family)
MDDKVYFSPSGFFCKGHNRYERECHYDYGVKIVYTNRLKVKKRIETKKKIVALTLDACGGGYDIELIRFLVKHKVKATMFVSGGWIKFHKGDLKWLDSLGLFQIENHGLYHRPLTVDGRMVYGVKGTENIFEMFEEIESNANIIENLLGKRPTLFRSGTGNYDYVGLKVANILEHTCVNFNIYIADEQPNTPTKTIVRNIIRNIHSGAIILAHMNVPKWNTAEALEIAIPKIREHGYKFVKLETVKDKLR